jgi:hypothetical protein
MSDYLWDKTGEADAEVERLEELLGGLRFQPRTFEVPATLPFVPRRATPARTPFNWSRLAVAASLLLTLLLGAWLIVSKQRTVNTPQLVNNQRAQEEKTAPPPPQQQAQPHTQQARQDLAVTTTDNGSTKQARNEKRDGTNRIVMPNVHRQQRDATLVAFKKRSVERPRHLNERDLNAPNGELAKNEMTPQEREAMGKFMLAMKVTSEKLGYAERQVAGLSHDSPQR